MEDEHFKSFDNTEDMFAYLEEQQKIAKELADQYNAKEIIPKYKYWATDEPTIDLVIVGKRWELPANPSDDDFEDEAATNEAMESGWIFAKWYSFACPEGELGDNHISRCYPIPEFIFYFCLDHIQGECG